MHKALIAVSAIAATTLMTVPALARPHYEYRREYNDRHHHGVPVTTTTTTVPVVVDNHHNWNWERNQYRHHWHKLNQDHQKELDAEMRAQWLAYHHNRWHGSYTWNNYRDPRFLDYLHRTNPSLLTRLRTTIGF
jgi:hypothetical protein